MIRLLPKLTLATAAAIGIYTTTLGLPLPKACAAPSRSCGSDLRECLRLSADMNPPAPFGVRYVTADQVAHCMETFNSCIHGGASRGGNQAPPTTSTKGGNSGTMPQRFKITDEWGHVNDCRNDGDAVTCTQRWEPLPDGLQSWTGSITATLSGSTMTGTLTAHQKSSGGENGCISDGDISGPISYVFSPGGTARLHWGPMQETFTYSGTCSDSPPYSDTRDALDTTSTWSPQ